MDNQALAEELRHHADRLKADLPTLEGDEAEAANATLHWLSDVLLAIAIGDEGAKDELLRQGEAASRFLKPPRDRLN